MDDRDITALLDKYRPAGPPAALRTRVAQTIDALTNPIHEAGNSPTRQLAWPWAVAAAALLAVTVALHGNATAPTLQSAVPSAAQLADGLGGGEAAMTIADFILSSPMTADHQAVEALWSGQK